MTKRQLLHSPEIGGFGDDDTPPPPPHWLAEGLSFYGGAVAAPPAEYGQGAEEPQAEWGEAEGAPPGYYPQDPSLRPTSSNVPQLNSGSYPQWGEQPIASTDNTPKFSYPSSAYNQQLPAQPTYNYEQQAEPIRAPSAPPSTVGLSSMEETPSMENFPASIQQGPPVVAGGAAAPGAGAWSDDGPRPATVGSLGLKKSDDGGNSAEPPAANAGLVMGAPPAALGSGQGMTLAQLRAMKAAQAGEFSPDMPAKAMPPMPPMAPAGSIDPLALRTATKEGDGLSPGDKKVGAVDKDGKPLKVPVLPEAGPDPGIPGRRAAGVAWIMFAGLTAFLAMLLGQVAGAGPVLESSVVVIAPLGIFGVLLLSGADWAGAAGIVLSLLVSVGIAGIGGLVHTSNPSIHGIAGLSLLPTSVGIPLMVVGFLFFVSNLLMLVKSPGLPRAVVGAFLVVVPQMFVVALVATAEIRPRLIKQVVPPAVATLGSAEAGYLFEKPEGWTGFDWTEATTVSVLAKGLKTEPDHFFLDKTQAMMVSFYLDTPPKRGLAELFQANKPTPLEEEIMRGLLPTEEKPATYELPTRVEGVAPKVVKESVMEGTTTARVTLALTITKIPMGEQFVLVVFARDAKSQVVTAADETAALNAFIAGLEFRK